MSDAHAIANKYAKAGFNVALKHDLIDQFTTDLQSFCQNVDDSMVREIANPSINKQDLAQVILEIAQKLKINDKVTQFILIVADSRRIKILHQINTALTKLVKNHKKILEAKVTTAASLNEKQLNQIKSTLQKKYPDNIIEINQAVKKDVLGGVTVQIGSLVIDASLKNQLNRITNELQSAII